MKKYVFCLSLLVLSQMQGFFLGNKDIKIETRTIENNALYLIDLTHTLNEQIPNWDGGCGFELHTTCDYKDCPDQYLFRAQMFAARAGIGTHIDAPSHCIQGGMDIHEIPLHQLYAPCVVIDVSGKADENYEISVDDIQDFEKDFGQIEPGMFVLCYTGWSQKWHDEKLYRNDLVFPHVSKEAAELLISKSIVGLGIDTLSPDNPAKGFAVHQVLLGAGKYIVENVAHAELLPQIGSTVFIAPLKIENGTESPVRMVAFVS